MIDDYVKAMDLMRKMKAHLPIPARPTKTFIHAMRDLEIKVKSGQNLQIESVLYAGDAGGISCAITLPGAEETAIHASLTHIRVPSNHPLFKEIRAYQIERIRKLALGDRHPEPTRFEVKPRGKKLR